ncbi:MAG: AAA family ATPase [Chloroflexota bacterium]|nr:AAA family ATPase [Chloroflexota bacterium]
MLKVTAKDFGPIVEGTVELKPLTIFVGPSNTGKSYMATAVHAVVNSLNGYGMFPNVRRAFWQRHIIGVDRLWDIPDEGSSAEKAALDWAESINEGQAVPANPRVSDAPPSVRDELNNSALQAIETFQRDALEYIDRVFGGNGSFIRTTGDRSNFQLQIYRKNPLLHSTIELDIGDRHPEVDITQAVIDPLPDIIGEEFLVGRDELDIVTFDEVYSRWIGYINDVILSGFPPESFYFPAARSGISQAYKVIGAELVRQSAPNRGNSPAAHLWLGTISEFVSNLIGLDRRRLRGSRPIELGDPIGFFEAQVVKGKIDMDESSELPLPDIVYVPKWSEADKFTLNQTSSMVSELAPIILFLKHLVRPGDLLILEEPESHLHPAAQRQMARGIVRLVNAGMKVLITTHSDYFLNQVNNLLRISHANEQWLEQHGFDRADCLQREDVSAYLFRWDDNEGGSLIEELTIRPDVGIDDDEFGKVVNDQYEETILVEGIPLK